MCAVESYLERRVECIFSSQLVFIA